MLQKGLSTEFLDNVHAVISQPFLSVAQPITNGKFPTEWIIAPFPSPPRSEEMVKHHWCIKYISNPIYIGLFLQLN